MQESEGTVPLQMNMSVLIYKIASISPIQLIAYLVQLPSSCNFLLVMLL
jgi:hypothetical protein